MATGNCQGTKSGARGCPRFSGQRHSWVQGFGVQLFRCSGGLGIWRVQVFWCSGVEVSRCNDIWEGQRGDMEGAAQKWPKFRVGQKTRTS